jgi:hypothetical protein
VHSPGLLEAQSGEGLPRGDAELRYSHEVLPGEGGRRSHYFFLLLFYTEFYNYSAINPSDQQGRHILRENISNSLIDEVKNDQVPVPTERKMSQIS